MKRLLFILLFLAIAGCAAIVVRTDGVEIDKSLVSELKPGVTTKGEVIDMFGSPTELEYREGTERLVYTYRKKKVPVHSGFVENQARARETVSTLEIILKKDKVFSYKFSSTEN